MKNQHNLGGFACVGATRTLTMQPVPDQGHGGTHVHLSHLVLEARMDITTIAGGSVTVRQLYEYLHSINVTILGRALCNGLNGWDLRCLLTPLAWQVTDMAADPAVIGAAVANAIRTVRLYIPFADPTVEDPSEGALPARILNEASQISINTLAATAIGVNATVNACDLTFYALTEDRSELSIPSLYRIGAADVQRFSTLPGGSYEALIFVEPVAHFAAADITTISVRGDHGPVINAISTDGVIACFAAQRGCQNFNSANRFADVPADYPFLPIISPEAPVGTRLSRLVPASRGLQLDIQGAAAALHAVWVCREPSASVAPDMLRALGAADPSQIQLAPQSGPAGTRPSFVAAERNMFLGRLKIKGALSLAAAGQLVGRIKIAPPQQLSARAAGTIQAAQAFKARQRSLAVAGDLELAPGGQGAAVWMVG